jgi:integrase
MAKLTVRAIEAARPKLTAYRLTVDRGLYLRVAVDGVKTWHVRYVVSGSQIEARLPKPYGTAEGYMSLADANAENARIQSLARDGTDFKKQRAKQEKDQADADLQELTTRLAVRTLFEKWLTNGVARKNNNHSLRRAFEKDVLPQIGDVPVKDVTADHIHDLLRKVAIRGVNRTIVLLLADIQQMFRWAEEEQPWRRLLVDGDPSKRIQIQTLVAPDYDLSNISNRILTDNEIRELRDIFGTMQHQYNDAPDRRTATRPVKSETKIALWLCLGTMCRIGELLMARWEHVNLEKGEWTIPRGNFKHERTDTRPDFVIFLSTFSKAQFLLLKQMTGKSPWCFPAKNLGDQYVATNSVSKQVGDRQTRFKQRSRPLKGRRCDDSLVLGGGGNGDWSPHDLRRTGSTIMQREKVDDDTRNRCLNHTVGSKLDRVYGPYDYAEEKRQAWELLGAKVAAILELHHEPNG